MIKSLFKILLFMVLIFFIGFGIFLFEIPNKPNKSKEKTDAVIVLTGGLNRIDTGFRILNDNHSQKLFISGVYNETNLKELFVAHHEQIKDLLLEKKRIEIGKEARSTRENAEETNKWIKKNNIKTLRLVTSNYHMPRSKFEFKRLLPNTKIITHPVFTVNFQKQKILQHKMTFKLALKEYIKFIYISAEYYLIKLGHVFS